MMGKPHDGEFCSRDGFEFNARKLRMLPCGCYGCVKVKKCMKTQFSIYNRNMVYIIIQINIRIYIYIYICMHVSIPGSPAVHIYIYIYIKTKLTTRFTCANEPLEVVLLQWPQILQISTNHPLESTYIYIYIYNLYAKTRLFWHSLGINPQNHIYIYI